MKGLDHLKHTYKVLEGWSNETGLGWPAKKTSLRRREIEGNKQLIFIEHVSLAASVCGL